MNGLWSQIFVLFLVRVLSLVFFREITRFNLFFYVCCEMDVGSRKKICVGNFRWRIQMTLCLWGFEGNGRTRT